MLSPYRVLDLTDANAQMGPMILADLGAEVIRVEAPDAARDGAAYHVFNRGKTAVELDLDSSSGREAFLELVRSADFLFENAAPGAMAARRLGWDQLKTVNAGLVYVAVSPFGQDGPYADHLATDLTLAAMGGMAALNGEADRPPVRIAVPQCWHHAAAESAAAALIAHHRRVQTGEGQFVDVSVQAAVTWTAIQAMTAYAVQGRNIERSGTVLQLGVINLPLVFPALDGEVVLAGIGGTVSGMVKWMIEDGTVPPSWENDDNWSQYDLIMLSGGHQNHPMPELLEKMALYTAKYPKEELLKRGLACGVTIAPVSTVADVLRFDHLQARGFWRDYEYPGYGMVRVPGAFARPHKTPLNVPGPAPASVSVPASHHPAPIPSGGAPGRLPFEGLKIADFAWIGAGPVSVKYFADHGAEVIRVETTMPPDRLRNVGPFKDGVQGVNRSQFFAMANASKKGIVLDLKSEAGKEVAKKLLAWCDIAFESFTPGTMSDLGLGYETAKELNPDVIMVSTCLMGQTGPARSLAGYGYHAAAIAGFYEVTGWPDRPPGGPFTAYTDIVAPHFLAATVAAAIDHHRRTGEGQYIEQSQMESALNFLAPELLEHQLSGAVPRRNGNDDPAMAPHAIFRSAGEDQWIAIACETDAQWLALAAAMGTAAPTGADLSTFGGRCARKRELESAIGAWTAAHDRYDLMALLQAAGVPAGAVQRSSDLLQDPQLGHRRYFRPLEHPEMGLVPYEGHQFRIAGYDNGPRFAAPCLSEHTWDVLTETLGLDEGAAAELLSAGGVGV
jgi:crotonobetainyl-CoA:carnitine CoA-transferase CaiB-like acyl-CoA transferase